jgi:hypothetical protein
MPDTVWGDIPAEIPSFNIADKPPSFELQPSENGFVGLPVRADGDKVFLLKGGKRYWVTSAEVFAKLGFKFGDEVKIDQATLSVIPEGEPIR